MTLPHSAMANAGLVRGRCACPRDTAPTNGNRGLLGRQGPELGFGERGLEDVHIVDRTWEVV
ncbi:MAG TPA: hypothetical protein VIS06_00585, partial [Mycobacteriales bacterium]